MIIKLEEKFDIARLKEYVDDVIKSFPPNMKKDGPWGGWSITSANGSYLDGWQTGEKIHSQDTSSSLRSEIKNFFDSTKFDIPTEIYRGYIIEVIEQIKKMGILPSRIRIAVLKPHPEPSAYWHIDGEASSDRPLLFRLHIPVETNSLCTFEYEDSKHHLIADGSCYLVNVSKKHRALNLSNVNRYHIIMDIEKSI